MLREPSYLDESFLESREKGTNFQILKSISPYVLRYPKTIALAICSIFLASLTVLGIGMGLRYFVDHGFSDPSSPGLTYSIFILFAIVFVMALSSFGRLYTVSQLSERAIADLREDIFKHLLNQDVPFFESTQLGEIQARLTTDTTLVQIILGTSLPIALRNAVIILGGLIMLLLTSPFLTGIIAFVIPLVLIPLLTYGKKVRRYSRLAQEKTAGISTRLDETFGAIRTVFAFAREAYMNTLFTQQVETTYLASLKQIKARATLTALVMILVFGAICLVLWYGGQAVLQERLSAGELSSFIFYAAVVAGSAGSLSEIHGDLLRAAGGAERIFAFFNHCPEHAPQAHATPLLLKGDIQFKGVDFSYPSRPEQQALSNVSFDINPGETIAFVGPSGAGKSTIFNLLLRFYDPSKGQIIIDGTPLSDLNISALRQAIGLVPQDPYLFSTTILENIRFGNLEADEDMVKKAAIDAYADEFIKDLPHGYHTHVGEKGCTLSGGQRQRIAIARAILKKPSLLLLDEATSALDTESEQKVQKALSSLKKNCTTLIIAHRLSTVQKADRLIVLNQGKVEEIGPASLLAQKEGTYQSLLQASLK